MPNIGTREDFSVLRFRKGGSTRYFTSGILDWPGTSRVLSIDTLYGMPFFVAKTEKFDRIAINVIAVGTAGTKARLGIYADDGTVAPGRLVLDAGEVAVDAIAVVQVIISQELEGGKLYWLVLVCNGTPALMGYGGATLYSVLFGLDSALGTSWGVAVSRSFTYAALPDPFGTPTITTPNTLAIYLRKV